MLKLVKDAKSITITEFEAHLLKAKHKDNLLEPGRYEFMRTLEFVVYNENRKSRTKKKIYVTRLLALLAKENKCLMKYDEEHCVVSNCIHKNFIIAECVKSKAELEFHQKKYPGAEIISLTKSKLCRYFVMDTKTIRDYYENYEFPEWFKPYLKMRAIRAMSIKNRWIFNSRRYTDSSKHTAAEKFRYDIRRFDIGKVYYTLCRNLDALKDRTGECYPIDVILPVLDIDADKDHYICEFNSDGYCVRCMYSARKKLAKMMERLHENFPEIDIMKILFSGSKGYHVYLGKEINRGRFIEIIETINEKEDLVDSFIFEKNGKKDFDPYRIIKLVNTVDSTSACIISDKMERLPVRDYISEAD